MSAGRRPLAVAPPSPSLLPPLPQGCPPESNALFRQALTHRSSGARGNNERLEFLGDAVLSMLIAEELYRRCPDADEGSLSRLRAALVENRALTRLAGRLSLSGQLRLGGSVDQPSDAMLADALEAVIGALYLDFGFDYCRKRVLDWYRSELDGLSERRSGRNEKTELQETMQARGAEPPAYHVLGEHGKPHEREYTVLCAAADAHDRTAHATARARGKGEAERLAARTLLQCLTRGQARSPRAELHECMQCLGRVPPRYSELEFADGEYAVACTVAGERGALQRVCVRASGLDAAKALAAEQMLVLLCEGSVA